MNLPVTPASSTARVTLRGAKRKKPEPLPPVLGSLKCPLLVAASWAQPPPAPRKAEMGSQRCASQPRATRGFGSEWQQLKSQHSF